MSLDSEIKGWIFDIQRYSINDGPGIRTTVFFKGCLLQCLWCDNPESQKSVPEILYFEPLCVRCYRCVRACEPEATSVGPSGDIIIDREKCVGCGKCAEVCLSQARVLSGKQMTVRQVLEVVKKDSLFYTNSGGGVTASGGEPLYQPEFLKELLRLCRESGIHTALETSGMAKWVVVEGVLPYIDLFLYDIKHLNPEKHRQLTGVDNGPILENLRKIVSLRKAVILRAPLIPGCNDEPEELEGLAGLATGLGLTRIDIMPYHRLGQKKYERLGRRYALEALAQYQEDTAEKIRAGLVGKGLDVRLA